MITADFTYETQLGTQLKGHMEALDSKKDAKQLVRNLDQIKIFNGLYGGLDVTEVEELLFIPEIL